MDGKDHDPIADLIVTYNELNSSFIEELHEEPSALEFMRFVARNTPFVVRGGAANWKATQTWTAEHLSNFLGDETVNVAVTPFGNADAPTIHPQTGSLVFAKPHEEDQPFSDFLAYVIHQEKTQGLRKSEVRYAQTQNDNLRQEYLSLYSHVPPTIPWARIALSSLSDQEAKPEAINLWIGNSLSTTALHKDNYENVYVQIRGRKHFVLLPPHCLPCVNESELKSGGYVRRQHQKTGGGDEEKGETGEEEGEGQKGGELELVMEKENDEETGKEKDVTVPFAIWDPDKPEENATRYSKLAEPMRVTLEEGDMLYLPAMWYHKVSQSCSQGGICVAVNYWYDMDFTGPLYPFTSFVRAVNQQQQKYHQ
ncbi:cupin-like domain-containing protein [Pseudoneurospora amorphoporcata]|uniref:Cupin-like domain-containing protein n=1 Tax=Pseudoneurospora amorphoporcata TaxID=241081 RepID=A0AAN6P4B8_9PEZI|nr:cupin-like domain-containing protein [Pseudoneurospora amorphoporcata]